MEGNTNITRNASTEENNPINIAPDDSRMTSTVRAIMDNCVAKASQSSYTNENVNFVLWLLGEETIREMLLAPWFLDRGAMVREQGEQGGQTIRKRVRKVVKESIQEVNKDDNNCPVLMENLTFHIFSRYMSDRKRRRGKGASNILSSSMYELMRSGLNHLYRSSGTKMDEEFSSNLKIFMAGMKRTVTNKKIERGESVVEGKKKMSFEVYELMCECFLKGEDSEYIFAHAFLTLEWNLMARSENVVEASFINVFWSYDSLIFLFPKSKCDQTGRNSDQLWHVYANPQNPKVCPVLALAKYIFSFSGIIGAIGGDGEKKIFPGSEQYSRFMRSLKKVVKKNKNEFESLGIDVDDLGSHSARKGAASYASAGCTVSPPMTAICLRACWSMGPVKERYLHYEKAGDQFLGRVVTGQPRLHLQP